jgi:competence protein ComEA
MNWLYRIQARAGLSGPEGTAALLVVLALTLGFVSAEVHSNAAPVAPDFYAAADAAFARPVLDSTSAPTAPVALVSTLPTEALPLEEWADTLAAGDDAAEPSPAALAAAEVEAGASSRRTGKPPPRRLNINTASETDLQCLPRIGPALAARIVEYRRVHGRFRSAEEINEVKGIGDRTMEKLAPWIYV